MSKLTRFQFEQMISRHPGLASLVPAPPAEKPLEKELHQDIMDYCDQQWPRWKFVHSRMDKPTRNQSGVPDFVVFMSRHRVIIVEAKRIGEKPSPAQRDWIAEMKLLEWDVRVVHTLQEFLDAVKTTTA